MLKRDIFSFKEEYKEIPFFWVKKSRNTPTIDQAILDKVFLHSPNEKVEPFSKELEKNVNKKISLRGFINSQVLSIFDGIKEYFSPRLKNNLFAIKQDIDIRNPFFNEVCFFYLSDSDRQRNNFIYTEHCHVEIEGIVKINQKLPYTKYIEVEKIAKLGSQKTLQRKPVLSYTKLINIFNELYKNKDLAESLVINLISSPNRLIKNPSILPLNKTLVPKQQIATDVKHIHGLLLNDLRKIFNPFYFNNNNPLIRINWMDNSDKKNIVDNGLNICPSNQIMKGDEWFNQKSVYPIFLNSESVSYEDNNSLIELNREIISSILYYRLLSSEYDFKKFDLENFRFFKDKETTKSNSDLKFFVGSCSGSFINNPSIYARTGGNFLIGSALNKVDGSSKDIFRINENTLITEFEDVIPDYQKAVLIRTGEQFMRLHNNKIKSLIKDMNDKISIGKIHGLNNGDVEEILIKNKLRQDILEQAIELGVIVYGFEGLRPHYYHMRG